MVVRVDVEGGGVVVPECGDSLFVEVSEEEVFQVEDVAGSWWLWGAVFSCVFSRGVSGHVGSWWGVVGCGCTCVTAAEVGWGG